jgi:hypothetical protein
MADGPARSGNPALAVHAANLTWRSASGKGHRQTRRRITLRRVVTAAEPTVKMAVMRSHVYEITFTGRAGAALREEFDDCEVTVGPDSTTLRVNLPDQGALYGLLQRIGAFALELTQLQIVPPSEAASTSSQSPAAARDPADPAAAARDLADAGPSGPDARAPDP